MWAKQEWVESILDTLDTLINTMSELEERTLWEATNNSLVNVALSGLNSAYDVMTLLSKTIEMKRPEVTSEENERATLQDLFSFLADAEKEMEEKWLSKKDIESFKNTVFDKINKWK